MHVVFFFRDIQNGGVQRNLIRLSELLSTSGHRVTFIIAVSGVNEFQIAHNVDLLRLNTTNPIKLAWLLAKACGKLRPDIVFSAMPNYNAIAVISKWMTLRKLKVVVSERSHTSIEYKNTKWGTYKLAIVLSPILYRLADGIVAVSDETAQSLTDFSGIKRGKIASVHNPVVGPKLKEMIAATVEHKWLTPPYEPIVAVGRLSDQKDYPTMIIAFAKVVSARPHARLLVFGEGHLLGKLQYLAEQLKVDDKILFMGFEPNPYKWMAKAKIFLLSSLWEGLPTVVIEALACGATIVATDSPSGPRQIIKDSKFGYLVPMGDSDNLAKCVLYAMDHPIERAKLVQEAEKYSEANSLRLFMNVIHEVSNVR